MRRVLGFTLLGVLAVSAALFAVRVLTPLPSLEDREPSQAYVDTADTRLGRAIAADAARHPGNSGVLALASGLDAFAARLLLARTAERSIDVQYYIWADDTTGTLLFEALHAAAERGVRVRLLLDDNNTPGLDGVLAALDAHPLIEVRLFNPFVLRGPRWLGFATDFVRLNRRMHNKSFTVDSQATIVGGRNVGDAYFGAVPEGELVFTDLDVLAVGPVVEEVAKDFDRYWASGSSYPASLILPGVEAGALERLRETSARLEQDPAAAAYMAAVRRLPFVNDLLAGRLDLEWAPVRIVSDDPAKGLGRGPPEERFMRQLAEVMGAPRTSLEVVSPYLVPTASGLEAFTALVERGVRVRILSNSLAATDVDAVHAGYRKYRKPLLEREIALYEMRLVAGEEVDGGPGLFGSGASSLHAKTMAADRERIFIGSFNFDPRSANLNTELGFVIESPALAERLASLFDTNVPDLAYEVRLSPAGELVWIERRDGEVHEHRTEPGTTLLQRLVVRVLSWLPIDSLL